MRVCKPAGAVHGALASCHFFEALLLMHKQEAYLPHDMHAKVPIIRGISLGTVLLCKSD